MRRGYSKKRLTPECVRGEALSYVPRFHPACQRHRDARQDNRNTRRPNERSGKARRQVRHSVEQLAAAEGVQRGNWPLVTSCNGKAPARSSRAAREWYSRRVSWGASTVRAPLCPPLCGFVSVKANLNGPTISLRGRKVKSPLYPGARGGPPGPPPPPFCSVHVSWSIQIGNSTPYTVSRESRPASMVPPGPSRTVTVQTVSDRYSASASFSRKRASASSAQAAS